MNESWMHDRRNAECVSPSFRVTLGEDMCLMNGWMMSVYVHVTSGLCCRMAPWPRQDTRASQMLIKLNESMNE